MGSKVGTKVILAFSLVAFINAFVDLGHKINIQNTLYKVYDGSTLTYMTAIVNALILLPFIMLMTPAGFLSDRFNKNKIMRTSAAFSVLITIAICICYYYGQFMLAFAATFIMALQSALYSPAKYGYIKDLMGKDGLTFGNSLMQGIAIVAILSGMTVFSYIFEHLYADANLVSPDSAEILKSIMPSGLILVGMAICEYLCTLMLPDVTQDRQSLNFDFKRYIKGSLLKENMALLKSNDKIIMSVIAVSIFFAVSQMLLAAFPTYIKQTFNELNTFYVQLVLGASGLGIIAGSYITLKLSPHYIETGLIPLGAIGITICSTLLMAFDSLVSYSILFFVFGLTFSLVIIPLNSLMQFYAPDEALGKVLSGNNFIQNLAMLLFLIIAATVSLYEIDVSYLFYLSMITLTLGCIYILKKLPFSLARGFVAIIFRQRYRLNIEGFNHIPSDGGVLLLGNHVSFIDWAILQLALPRKVFFVIDRVFYEKWYLNFILKLFGVIPVSSGGSKKALKAIADKIKEGHMVCLFPEGCLSRHGQLNAFKKGFEMALKDLDVKDGVIIPFYIRGLWGSAFSRSHQAFIERQLRLNKRSVSIAFGRAMDIHSSASAVKAQVFELSLKAFKNQCEKLSVIGSAFIDTAKKYKHKTAIVDSKSGSISYIKMLTVCLLILKNYKQELKDQRRIGILLPASLASSVLNMTMLIMSKVVVNLNFTASNDVLASCVKRSQIKTIFTSRQFLQKLEKRGIVFDFGPEVKQVFAEDLFSSLKGQKSAYLFTSLMTRVLPAFLLKLLYIKNRQNSKTAAILFSSGSEGEPKGVMLSHMNIMSNIKQISDVLQPRDSETILSSLPPFHAFGLTVTTLLPLVEGIKSVTHADPTDAQGIARAVVQNEVSIMCGTSTFLGIYARSPKIAPVMFESLRVVVAGAEKLKSDVKQAFELKFKKDILEGYGATETTPVVSVNLPDGLDREFLEVHKGSKEGSVGMPLPGSTVRVVDPDTLQELECGEDGLILIGGHQVMKGYLNDKERTDSVIASIDGIRWYKSGDKGHLDADGFLHIVDRYSRFAKIGGEMISLSALENEIGSIISAEGYDSSCRFVAINIDDSKKGEKIVLLISHVEDLKPLQSLLNEKIKNALSRPSKIIKVNEVPLLGSGKVDFAKARAMAICDGLTN
ncbi:Bifunctional protein aas [Anaerobiospirillum thomasii]|uniref:acyl-[ACP]--phospholipid O-acyltransferase n=1 Tax=Anaerobiospirillum thomasii TaxID=179995 RepID=UPI000D9E07CD|nr:acyl-[ACP]--phospholipid O-acyltransferase [Anaerobiospirillum thomasii]SPT67923.1 Bifunctional protein aas [Anaerobiospirillum thomasii]